MIEIVAEAANGHDGDPARLALLIRLAAAAGADAVKFQMVFSSEIFTRDHPLFERFRAQECDDDEWAAAAALARSTGSRFYLDVFGQRSAALAQAVGADGVKIHATDVANYELLETMATLRIPRVLLGTGGGFRDEIAAALRILSGKDVVLVHGFQAYPTAIEDNQIARVTELRAAFGGLQIGFADHVPLGDARGLWLPAVAVGAGATLIEKHITLAAVLRGTDHEAALGPDEFGQFVANMRAADAAFGAAGVSADDDFGMAGAEHDYRARVRKALVAARDVSQGEVLTRADVVLRRSPRPEAAALDPADVAGRRLSADVAADDPLHPALFDLTDVAP